MSAQLRFRTLVKHAGSIYDATKEARTDLLVGSLDDVVDKINPQSVSDWIKVEFDTRRLLKVWLSREQTHAAQTLADQILDSLVEFSATPAITAVCDLPGPLPHLEIVEKPATATTVAAPVAILLTHSNEAEDEDEEEDETVPAPAQVKVDADADAGAEADDESSSPPMDDEVDDEDEVEVEVEVEIDGEDEVEAEIEDEDEVEAEVEVDGEDEVEEVLEPEAEPEAASPDAEEEEEEGMEVEKRTIRGRDYWLEVNTNKLYAVIDDDDVGDEVGAIVNGRPVFISA